MKITINKEQRLYVEPCGKGFSCLGFDHAKRQADAVAKWLNRPTEPHRLGSERAYAYYRRMMKAGGRHNRDTGDRCNADLVPALVGLEGRRVECRLYGEVRRFIVGKSTGWMPCHLEVKTKRSTGGGPIPSDATLIRVFD